METENGIRDCWHVSFTLASGSFGVRRLPNFPTVSSNWVDALWLPAKVEMRCGIRMLLRSAGWPTAPCPGSCAHLPPHSKSSEAWDPGGGPGRHPAYCNKGRVACHINQVLPYILLSDDVWNDFCSHGSRERPQDWEVTWLWIFTHTGRYTSSESKAQQDSDCHLAPADAEGSLPRHCL